MDQYTIAPRVDVYENDDEFLVLTDLPHIGAADVNINYEGDTLRLDATPGDPPAGADQRYGYARTFRLAGIDADRIEARLDAGVLHLTLPKAAESRPRQIPVSTA